MSRKQEAAKQVAGIDKIESFLQNYFKQLIIVLAGIVVIFIGAYAIYSINQSSQMKKANLVGEAQALMISPTTEDVSKFQELTALAPFLKNYINLISGEEWTILDDNATALKSLAGVDGDYKELASGLSFDLGDDKVNINNYISNGAMKPLWYYRLVLSSEGEDRVKNLEIFKSKYPESKLLGLLENWN